MPKAASAWLSKLSLTGHQALALQRLKTRAQFQAVLAGAIIARSAHFALHRNVLGAHPLSPSAPNSHSRTSAVVDAVLAAPLAVQAGAETPSVQPAAVKGGVAGVVAQPLFPVADLWLGAMVPKRWAKRAVTRNAIKRQIYTVSADFSPQHRQAAFVVRLRRDFSRKEFLSASSDRLKQAVRTELLALLQEGARQS